MIDRPAPGADEFAAAGEPVWKLNWLTPGRCRALLLLVVGLTFFVNFRFITHNCPIELSGDEAQYWEWSRHLDLSYYSKGPLVAYIIRASCWLAGGDTMPAVRMPAIILFSATSLCTYWLTRKLFGSDRVALGSVLITSLVPVFIVGSIFMTIDPPFFFCWALATCLAAKAVFDNQRWPWPVIGVVVGIGFLAKYAMLLWLPSLLLALVFDRDARRLLRSPWPWIACAIALSALTPVLLWNAQHDWVSFHHVAKQTGAAVEGAPQRGNFFEFILSQLALLNPAVAVLMVGGVVFAFRSRKTEEKHRRAMGFLVVVGLPLIGLCALDSLKAKVQANWPVPGYFSLLILTAYFISTRLRSTQNWKPWRGWVQAAIGIGLVLNPILRDTSLLYTPVKWINQHFPKQTDQGPRDRIAAAKVDSNLYKMRGVAEFAAIVDQQRQTLPPDAFILCEDYQTASQLAFYLKDQPSTFVAGSYWTDPTARRRRTQWDIWPDRDLSQPALRGKDAIYIGEPYPVPGSLYDPLPAAFESIERLADVPIYRKGLLVRTFKMWKCKNFKGMTRPAGGGY